MNKSIIISCAGKFHAFSLAEQLAKNEMLDVFFTSFAYQKDLMLRNFTKRVDRENIPVERIKTFNLTTVGQRLVGGAWFWNELFDLWVANQLRRSNKDSIFIGWSGMSLHSLRVAKKKGMRTILTRGSAHIEVQNELLKEEYGRMGIRYSIPSREIKKEIEEYQLADHIAVPSSFAKNTFLAKGFEEKKLFMNPLGVNLEFFKRISHVEKINTRTEPTIIYLGNLSFQKGVVYLFEAIQILNSKGIKVKALFIGKIDKEIKAWLSKNELPNNCHLLGHIPQHELIKTLSECHIGVIPSIQDGFAQVIPQLLAAGIPVITTSNTGGPEIITNGLNGYIIPIRDSSTIADSIMRLIQVPEELQVVIENSQASVAEGFTWEDYGKRYLKFLDQI